MVFILNSLHSLKPKRSFKKQQSIHLLHFLLQPRLQGDLENATPPAATDARNANGHVNMEQEIENAKQSVQVFSAPYLYVYLFIRN